MLMNAARILARTEVLVLIKLTVIYAHVLLDLQVLIVKQVSICSKTYSVHEIVSPSCDETGWFVDDALD